MIVKLDKNIDTFENLQRTTPSSPQLQGQFQQNFKATLDEVYYNEMLYLWLKGKCRYLLNDD